MNIDPYIVLGSAVIGFLVGLTGSRWGSVDDADADPLVQCQAVDCRLE